MHDGWVGVKGWWLRNRMLQHQNDNLLLTGLGLTGVWPVGLGELGRWLGK